jgi:hypothetical protein
VGLFKSMKDLSNLTKDAKKLQNQKQAEAGYKPGMAGQFQQMGAMIGQASEQVKEIATGEAENAGLLAEGIAGTGVIIGMGTPARGASWFNLDIDLEVHVPGKAAYRVDNQYMVPSTATLGQGVSLPIKVDPSDPAKIAIDWDSAGSTPARGEVRPVSNSGFTAPQPPAAAASGGGDSVNQLERLAKLHKSGALTDTEFAREKAKILGS